MWMGWIYIPKISYTRFYQVDWPTSISLFNQTRRDCSLLFAYWSLCITHLFLLKGEEPPFCVSCDELLSLEHILLFCSDLIDIRKNILMLIRCRCCLTRFLRMSSSTFWKWLTCFVISYKFFGKKYTFGFNFELCMNEWVVFNMVF